MLPGRKGTAEEFGDLPTWLCAGSAPTTALGQASGLGVVTPARPAAGTAGARGILQLCLLRLFQAVCATCTLLFCGRPLIVLDVVCFFISCPLSCPDAPSPVILGTERPTSSPPRGCGVWAPARSPVSLSSSAVAHAEVVCRARLGDRARNPVFRLLDLFSCVFPRLWKLRRMSLGWVPGGGMVCVGILVSVHRVPLQPLLPASGGPPLRYWACALHPWVTFRFCSLPSFGSVF